MNNRTLRKLSRAIGLATMFAAASASVAGATDYSERLYAYDVLFSGDRCVSQDGTYQLWMHPVSTGKAILEHKVVGSPTYIRALHDEMGARAQMQTDGNFVLIDQHGWPKWATDTDGNSGAYLQVQNDSNIVVYSSSNVALWAVW